jgi:undecaprenyl-diphosphatase
MLLILLSSVWEQLEKLDQKLFIILNSIWTNTLFDAVLPFFRASTFWAPLYLFMLVFVALNYKTKGLWWIIGLLCAVAIADMTSSRVIKEIFDRLRPCREPDLFMQVRLLLQNCSPSPSFTSSHAANHFSIATFISLTFFNTFKRWIYLAYVWAALVAYAQVYVGVHYPLDVTGGALLGASAGLLCAKVFNYKVPNFTIE